jgi:hypothetical protein
MCLNAIVQSWCALKGQEVIISRGSYRRKDRPDLSWAFARLLSVTADDLDPISGHSVVSVIHLERDVLDQECPDLVTEPICVEAALQVGKGHI